MVFVEFNTRMNEARLSGEFSPATSKYSQTSSLRCLVTGGSRMYAREAERIKVCLFQLVVDALARIKLVKAAMS